MLRQGSKKSDGGLYPFRQAGRLDVMTDIWYLRTLKVARFVINGAKAARSLCHGGQACVMSIGHTSRCDD